MSFFALFWQASLMVKMVMLLLVVCSILSWMLIAYKFISFRNIKNDHAYFLDMYGSAENVDVVRNGALTMPESPLLKVFLVGYHSCRKFSKEQREYVRSMMEITLEKEVATLEKEVSFFATLGSVAPFIGLFGTVWGIMNSFQAIGLEKNATIASVAPGIAEALFATALGLTVTIPAVIAYNMCVKFIDNMKTDCEHFIDEFMIMRAGEDNA